MTAFTKRLIKKLRRAWGYYIEDSRTYNLMPVNEVDPPRLPEPIRGRSFTVELVDPITPPPRPLDFNDEH